MPFTSYRRLAGWQKMADIHWNYLQFQDYRAALALWETCEGVRANEDEAEFARILIRNPELSPCAWIGNELAGAVLCCHDGRRGYLYHLGVAPQHRGRGIASKLVSQALVGLRREHIGRCSIHVIVGNEAGEAFWRKIGWRLRTDLKVLAIDLD